MIPGKDFPLVDLQYLPEDTRRLLIDVRKSLVKREQEYICWALLALGCGGDHVLVRRIGAALGTHLSLGGWRIGADAAPADERLVRIAWIDWMLEHLS